MEEHENYAETYGVQPLYSTEDYEALCKHRAYELAAKRLGDGTAKEPLIIHFLKLQTEETKLQAEKLRADTELAKAKVEAQNLVAIEAEKTDKLLEQLRRYQGSAYGGYDEPEDVEYYAYEDY